MTSFVRRVGVALPAGAAKRWHSMALEALGGRGVGVAWREAAPPLLPMPWRALLNVERALSRPKADPFAKAGGPGGQNLDAASPEILVLPPGAAASPGLLEKLPLGAFEFEPVHPSRFSDGAVEGRMLWRRQGLGARVAASTFTCLRGPFPLGWAGAHLCKAALMPARALARLDIQGEAFWESLPEAEPLAPFEPDAAFLARFAAELAGFGLERAWLDIFHRRQWYLGLRPGNGDPTRPGFESEPFAPLLPPKGTGWADPFLFERDGRAWLFIEEIPGRQNGVLSVMEALPGGGFGPVRRVLAEPFHLSYPNVFEHGGQVWMVPETAGAGQVRLYRAEDFPGGWVLDRVLLEGVPATDATFLEHEGWWWLFASVRAPGGSSWDELHLYRSRDRFGPYEAHPLNPVVSDVRRARPAGPVARVGERLLRPAQDSSGWYGRALNVMEIVRLDWEGYEERPAARLEAGLVPGSFCLHTLEAKGGLEVVDGQRFVPLWR